jgi:MinD-like ATPase involved in chromosome partitioning or flagellar assembly
VSAPVGSGAAGPTPVLLLLGPSDWEGPLVAGLAHPSSRLHVVRRCLDPADLLAAAEAGLGRVVLLGADAPRVDADVVARVRGLGIAVVGIADDDARVERLQRWRVDHVVALDPAAVGVGVRDAVAVLARADTGRRAVAPTDPDGGADDSAAAPRRLGRVVTVWGAPGAPGRTSVAVAVADEAARAGARALLIDADTWAPSLVVTLALVDDGGGLASACRRALGATLDADALTSLVREVAPGFLVLPGIPRAGRWTEVRPAALTTVLEVARELVDLVVVDCASPIEADEELVFDTDAPRRNAATLVALESADRVLAVGSGDAVGLVRLVTALGDLADTVPGCDRQVVVTRARESVLGRRPAAAVSAALHRHAGVDHVVVVPDDRDAYDAAMRSGRTLAETAPASPARRALRSLALELVRDLVPEARTA